MRQVEFDGAAAVLPAAVRKEERPTLPHGARRQVQATLANQQRLPSVLYQTVQQHGLKLPQHARHVQTLQHHLPSGPQRRKGSPQHALVLGVLPVAETGAPVDDGIRRFVRHEVDGVADVEAAVQSRGAPAGAVDVARALVDADDVQTPLSQRHRQAADAAALVQNGHAGLQTQLAEEKIDRGAQLNLVLADEEDFGHNVVVERRPPIRVASVRHTATPSADEGFSMPQMRALVKRGSDVRLRLVPVPEPGRDEVRVGVRLAGLCRTDVQVALGQLPAADPLILGHEFAGVVDALGPGVTGPRLGQRVAVLPVLGCGRCSVCRAGDALNCPRRTMLGVDRDGAFAEFVCVPSTCVYPLPDGMAEDVAAYAEPVAAALAVLDGGIRPEQRGLILGRNRFAVLVERLLRAHGFGAVETDGGFWPDDSFDFLVETRLDDGTVAEMIRLARPGATLLLKSRLPGCVAVPVLPLLAKRLTLRGLNYGCFRTALRLLAEGTLGVSDLLGPVAALEDFAALCERSGAEAVKFFLDPGRIDVRHPG